MLAKYGAEGGSESIALAEEAFRRALELDPDLPVAHNFYTYFEIEEKARAPEAMVRLLERVGRGAADPHLFAGLVVACRFCGLLVPRPGVIRLQVIDQRLVAPIWAAQRVHWRGCPVFGPPGFQLGKCARVGNVRDRLAVGR